MLWTLPAPPRHHVKFRKCPNWLPLPQRRAPVRQLLIALRRLQNLQLPWLRKWSCRRAAGERELIEFAKHFSCCRVTLCLTALRLIRFFPFAGTYDMVSNKSRLYGADESQMVVVRVCCAVLPSKHFLLKFAAQQYNAGGCVPHQKESNSPLAGVQLEACLSLDSLLRGLDIFE